MSRGRTSDGVAADPPPRVRLFDLGWPLFVELLLGMGVGVVATMLAARSSDASGAALALANHVGNTLFMLFRVIGVGVGVVVSQQLGAGQRDAADRLARTAFGASLWLGLAIAAVAALGAGTGMRLMNAPDTVAAQAEPLLRLLALAMPLDAVNACLASVLRAHVRGRVCLLVVIVMDIVHLGLAVPLMGGAGPVPALGLTGFALALGASRLVAMVLFLALWRRHLGLVVRRGDLHRLPGAELGAMLHIGAPAAAESVAWRLAFTTSVSAVGLLGTAALAAQAYVQQVSQLLMLFGVATGLAMELLVGRLIGERRLHAAHRMVRQGLARGVAVSGTLALAGALAGPWVMRLFTHDVQIVRTGAQLLWCTVLLETGRSFNLVVINALRSAGDARFPLLAGVASMVLVLAGGSWLLGIVCGFGLLGVMVAYVADEWIRGLLMWHRWTSLGWVPQARRSRRRFRRAP